MFKQLMLTAAIVLTAASANAVETTRAPKPAAEAPAPAPAKGRMQIDLPKNWASDNGAGANQGVGIVFFPQGGSWAKSPAVIYVRTIGKVNNSVIRAIDEDIAIYKETAPQAKLTDEQSLVTKDGKIAILKKLKDEKSGNLEYISYITEENDVSVITLNAKTEDEAKKAWPAFKEIVNSYRYIKDGSAAPAAKPEEKKAEEKKEVKKEAAKPTVKPAAKPVKAETKPVAKKEVKAETKPKEETKK